MTDIAAEGKRKGPSDDFEDAARLHRDHRADGEGRHSEPGGGDQVCSLILCRCLSVHTDSHLNSLAPPPLSLSLFLSLSRVLCQQFLFAQLPSKAEWVRCPFLTPMPVFPRVDCDAKYNSPLKCQVFGTRLSHQQLTRVQVTSQTWDVTPPSIGRSVLCRLLQRDTYTDCHAIRHMFFFENKKQNVCKLCCTN